MATTNRSQALGALAGLFLRIGNTTVGGGDPTTAALQRALEERGWLSTEQFGIAYAMARITPGTNLLAFCAATGWFALGVAGAVAAVTALTIPSSVFVVWLTYIYETGERVPWIGAALSGSIAAGIGVMVATACRLAKTQMKGRRPLIPLLIVGGVFLARLAGVSPLQALGCAALVGLFARDR